MFGYFIALLMFLIVFFVLVVAFYFLIEKAIDKLMERKKED